MAVKRTIFGCRLFSRRWFTFLLVALLSLNESRACSDTEYFGHDYNIKKSRNLKSSELILKLKK